MIIEWLKKLNLIYGLGEMNYHKYIPLPSITYGYTGVQNMSLKKKKKKQRKKKKKKKHTKSFPSWSTVAVQLKARIL